MDFFGFVFAGALVEASIFVVRSAIDDWKKNRWALIAVLVGSLVSYIFGLDLPGVFGVNPVVTGILASVVVALSTGLVVGRGASGFNDFYKLVRGRAEVANAEAVTAQVEAKAADPVGAAAAGVQ